MLNHREVRAGDTRDLYTPTPSSPDSTPERDPGGSALPLMTAPLLASSCCGMCKLPQRWADGRTGRLVGPPPVLTQADGLCETCQTRWCSISELPWKNLKFFHSPS